ncbi:MAG: SurA N-terminal domain-containing protein [Hyphomicrobium sp.]|nr:SurA N-terminal domain-containing protein [Hyphomicrobium sp.]
MLEALRRGASGILGKLLMGLLILSFAVWGIADVFNGFGRGALARVGDAEISEGEYNRVLRTDLDALSQEIGRHFTIEDARREGYDRLVLSKLIGQSALAEYGRQLNLGLSPEKVIEDLKADPDFHGPDGKFSNPDFKNLLSRLDLSESAFLKLRTADEIRQQISSAILAATVVPDAVVDIEHKWNNETRTLSFFKIDAAKAATVPEPDDAKLRAYFDEHKSEFMTPEFRKFSALVLSADALKTEVQVSEDEIKSAYAEDKASYDKPEKRRIQQIAFKDRATAEATRDAIEKGTKNFMDAAKELGAKESDVNLGMLTKKQLIDPAIADAAFSVERDALSPVIDGRFATVVVRVIEIEPGLESTLDSARQQVKDKIVDTKVKRLVQERADLIEEGRNAGKTLKEIADELKLTYYDVPASDIANKTPDGKEALAVKGAESVVDAVFAAEIGAETEPIDLGTDGYAWFRLDSIEKPAQKEFETVKADVTKAWKDEESERLVKEVADKLVERIKAGEDIAKVAEGVGNAPEMVEDILRKVNPPGLTEDAVEAAFALPVNGAASALTPDRGSRVVMQVKSVKPAAEPTKAEKDKIVSTLQRDLQNDVLIAYVTHLQEKLGVSINESEFKRVTGADVAAQ